MEANGVSLLRQLRESGPLDTLRQFGIPLCTDQGTLTPRSNTIEGTRQRLLSFLSMAHSAHGSQSLRDSLSSDLAQALVSERGASRNRHIFLVTVLAADAPSAAALSNGGVVEALCAMFGQREGETLSETERHWVLIALAALGSQPGSAECVRRHALAPLCALLQRLMTQVNDAAAENAGSLSGEPALVGIHTGASAKALHQAAPHPPSAAQESAAAPAPLGRDGQSDPLQPPGAEVIRSLSSSSSPRSRKEKGETASLVGMGYAAGGEH